nr:hypothetical protein CFP56_65122 [Quercus suber]
MPSLVIEVEVLVARRALELGLDNIILEGDSEILLKALKNGCQRSSYILRRIGEDLRDFLTTLGPFVPHAIMVSDEP